MVAKLIERSTHQDVKPANIMFSPKYNGDFSKTLFKLIDFASTEFEKGVYVENKKVRTGETQMFSESYKSRCAQALICDKAPQRYVELIRYCKLIQCL